MFSGTLAALKARVLVALGVGAGLRAAGLADDVRGVGRWETGGLICSRSDYK